MAKCPRCGGDLGQTDVICPRCGYDFPESRDQVRTPARAGFAYSGLAHLALVVGQLMAGVGVALAVVGCVISVLNRQWLDAVVRGPVTAILLLAMLVVFARVQDVGRGKS